MPARRRRGSGALIGTLVVALAGAAGIAWWQGDLGAVPVRERCTATAAGRSASLDPEQAANAATITSIAVSRGLPARAATIGIATAMQESKLRNIDYGDRDSLGLFQQRPSQGWGTPEQVMDPVYAANAFYDVLIKIEGYETAAITDAAQQVQRSAFPTAYAQHEAQARVLASALSGYSTAAFTCELRQVDDASEQAVIASGFTPRAEAVAQAVAREATNRKPTSIDESGTGLRYDLAAGGEAQRLGWSLAHWAVANARALDIVAVRTDGQQWRRDASRDGWTDADADSDAAAAVGPGVVEIVVAGGPG